MGWVIQLVPEGGEVFGELVGGGQRVGDSEVKLRAEDLVKSEGVGVIDDVEGSARSEVLTSEGKVAGKLVGNHRDVAIAEGVVIEVADDHYTEEDGNGKDGGDAGVRVGGEKVITFIQDVAETVSDENGERQQ